MRDPSRPPLGFSLTIERINFRPLPFSRSWLPPGSGPIPTLPGPSTVRVFSPYIKAELINPCLSCVMKTDLIGRIALDGDPP